MLFLPHLCAIYLVLMAASFQLTQLSSLHQKRDHPEAYQSKVLGILHTFQFLEQWNNSLRSGYIKEEMDKQPMVSSPSEKQL